MVYAWVDGGMILTRDEGRKERKLGRVFKSGDCLKDGAGGGCIAQSQYIGYLGKKEPFCRAMDELLDQGRIQTS